MTASVGTRPQQAGDPEVQQAVAAFHMGQWNQAIPLLEALLVRYPDDPRISRMLDDARFKASLEAGVSIHEKRWIFPWRSILVRVLMIGAVIALLVLGFAVVRTRVLPTIAEIQRERQVAQLIAQAQTLQSTSDFAGATEKYNAALAIKPNNQAALDGLAEVKKLEDLFKLYNDAVAAETADDLTKALSLYSQIQIQSPGYRDVSSRVLNIRRQQDLDKLYKQATTRARLGLEADAIAALDQIQSLDVNYRRDEIGGLLYQLNMTQGMRLIGQTPADPSQVPVASDFFNAALSQRPNDTVALMQARLAHSFITGRSAYDQHVWPEAANQLTAVFNESPNYLDGQATNMLYTALIALGDQYLDSKDLLNAYEQYQKACNLPTKDTVMGCAKMNSVVPMLTPTPTPTLTPTPAPTLPPAPSPSATPTPTPRPLQEFRGRILFTAEDPDHGGGPSLWVMDPDGSHREYLGPQAPYGASFDALREKERFSPDGTYSVSTDKVDGRPQVIMHLPFDPRWGQLPPQPLTRLTGIAYDPVWSPDGSWIAFTTQEDGSDDIWIIRPDASEQKSLVKNVWEWDKHPSWSPDSQRIVFFSNRAGDTQIYVMDANGQNVKNISNVPWNEYDPMWVK